MKAKLEIDDLSTTLTAFNNALIAYGSCSYAASLGAEVPEKLQHLSELTSEELKYRFNCLKNLYDQLTALETNAAHFSDAC